MTVTASNFNPSNCEITKATVTPYGQEAAVGIDISATIYAWHVEHGISTVSLSGSISVLDNEGFLEELPLRGEETLELEFKGEDLNVTRRITAQVHKIDNVNSSLSNKGVTYTLHWVSKPSWDGFTRSLIKSYKQKKVSSIVKDIFDKYILKTKEYTTARQGETFPENTEKYDLSGADNIGRKLYIQTTDGNIDVIIPDYMPTEAISFVLKRAHNNTTTTSSSYRFFERWDGFYCVSDEWLYEHFAKLSNKRTRKMNFSADVDMDATSAEEQIKALTSFTNNTRANPAKELVNGAYKNTIVEIDLLKHHARRYNYTYNEGKNKFTDVTGNKSSWESDIHTKKYADDTFTNENAKQFMIIRDYRDFDDGKSFTGERHFRDVVARRIMYLNHMHSTSVSASTDGRLDINAGDVINVDVMELNQSSNQSEKNPQLSGNYLVTHVINSCEKDMLKTELTLFKYGWSGAGSDSRSGRMGGMA